MKIGIIVHSHTGNTLQVAEKIREALAAQGHTAELERVRADKEGQAASGKITLLEAPDADPYDVILFGAPVQAFSLSPVMKTYLAGLPSLKGKRVGCFVTQRLLKPWMGGNRAVKQIFQFCKDKGADISESGIVHWSDKSRESRIADVASKLARV